MSKSITYNQHNGYEFVEIGGIKWATCNVGAEKPTDIGLYFQWGDRKGYTFDEAEKINKFDWEHYKHYNGRRLTKYNGFDGKLMLDLCDDAAFSYMGYGWRMPTQDDFRCLFESTTQRWVFNYQDSGVAGMVFTDITDVTKELFFPAAGFCGGNRVYGLDGYGYYWSRSVCSGHVCDAYQLYFGIGYTHWNGCDCIRYGYPVRGILTT